MEQNKGSAWKEAIEAYFPECLQFFFPEIAQDIDFDKGYDFLDKELPQFRMQKVAKDWPMYW